MARGGQFSKRYHWPPGLPLFVHKALPGEVKGPPLPKDAIPEIKKGSGRPATIISHSLNILERYVKKDPRLTAHIIKQEVLEVAYLTVWYISHLILKCLKIPSRIASQKPLLTEKMKEKRLAFAKKYRNWSEEDWSKVMFSDESTFSCLRATRSRVRQLTEQTILILVTWWKHPDILMVWGCFASNGRYGGIYFLPKNQTMNSVRYLEVLRDHLLDCLDQHGCLHFLQDGPHALCWKRWRLFWTSWTLRSQTGRGIPLTLILLEIAGITWRTSWKIWTSPPCPSWKTPCWNCGPRTSTRSIWPPSVLNAQEDCCHHQEHRRCDQILVEAFV